MKRDTAKKFVAKEIKDLGWRVEDNLEFYSNMVELSEIVTRKELVKTIEEANNEGLLR